MAEKEKQMIQAAIDGCLKQGAYKARECAEALKGALEYDFEGAEANCVDHTVCEVEDLGLRYTLGCSRNFETNDLEYCVCLWHPVSGDPYGYEMYECLTGNLAEALGVFVKEASMEPEIRVLDEEQFRGMHKAVGDYAIGRGLGMGFLVKLAPLDEPWNDAGAYVATSANWEALERAVKTSASN